MKKFKLALIMMLILSLTVQMSFAQKNHDTFIVGDLSEVSDQSVENITFGFLQNKMSQNDYKIKKKYLDNTGMTTVRVDQYFNNTKIYASDLIINVNQDGIIKSFVGELYNFEGKLSKQIKKNINKNQAIEIALSDLGNNPSLIEESKPEVLVYQDDDSLCYVYELELVFDDPTPARWFYYIDTATGEIINKMNLNSHGKPVSFNANNTTEGSGTDVIGHARTFYTNYNGGKYYLADLTRGNGIYTYDAKGRTRLPGSYWTDSDNRFNTSYDAPAVSAQYYMGITYDYYLNKFNINSFDNNGATIISSVHVGNNYNNAYWNGRQFAFGDGDGSTFIPLSGSLDVIAHEYTHAITENTAGLIYQNESGALNEAMSDIMGASVEFYLNEDPDWLLGEDIAGPGLGSIALRSLADPTLMGDPDHYSDIYTGTQDNGGVHTNSGVINKVAYLIGAGGTHYGMHVQGQGIEVMENVFYRALTTYMTSSTNFYQARLACIQSAKDLYGTSSVQVQTVEDAFYACGIY